ncbi:hypothetical protein EMGBS15_08640 [Filimonas sp.]|nr:hypothetical protein EMGBS15_08640 [Filimonas sp.]
MLLFMRALRQRLQQKARNTRFGVDGLDAKSVYAAQMALQAVGP